MKGMKFGGNLIVACIGQQVTPTFVPKQAIPPIEMCERPRGFMAFPGSLHHGAEMASVWLSRCS